MPTLTAPAAAAPKRSPGPWRWSDAYKSSQDERTWSLIDGDGSGILSCDGEGNSPQGLGKQGIADAALIEAAPDLLEAVDHPLLRQLFGAIEDSGTPEAARLWALAQAWFEVRDAAIDKATGA